MNSPCAHSPQSPALPCYRDIRAAHSRRPARWRSRKNTRHPAGAPQSDGRYHQSTGSYWKRPPETKHCQRPTAGLSNHPATLSVCSTGARHVLLSAAKQLRFQATPPPQWEDHQKLAKARRCRKWTGRVHGGGRVPPKRLLRSATPGPLQTEFYPREKRLSEVKTRRLIGTSEGSGAPTAQGAAFGFCPNLVVTEPLF